MKTTLVLLPNLLDESLSHEGFLPANINETVNGLDGLIAESEKGARKFLMRFSYGEEKTFRDVPIHLLNEHSDKDDIDDLVELLNKGGRWGLISDCGLPCIADPGAQLVARMQVHRAEVEVVPGPSSIIMALMLSGISSKSFSFNGYLPKKPEQIKPSILQQQKASSFQKQTQIYIEAPYRSKKTLQYLISYLAPDTELCVAWNLTLKNQGVATKTVSQWKGTALPDLNKTPAVFLFRAAPAKNLKKSKGIGKKGRFYDPRKKRRRKMAGYK